MESSETPKGNFPATRHPRQPPLWKVDQERSIWDDDEPQDEPEYITCRQILPVVGWICGYVVIGLGGIPMIAALLYMVRPAARSHDVDGGWVAMGALYGILLIAMPIWFIGFPPAYFMLRKASRSRFKSYALAALVTLVPALIAWTIFSFG